MLLKLNMSEPATISGGPLKGKYVFTQLHFHWGTNDSFGSEDLINNHRYRGFDSNGHGQDYAA